MIVEYRDAVRVLMFTTIWGNIKPPGMMQRTEFFKTINSMNYTTMCCQCSVDEKDPGTLYMMFYMYVTESISRLDITSFVNMSGDIALRVTGDPRVRKLCA
jgi:hypothetical protein